jgi:hypothetical protein
MADGRTKPIADLRVGDAIYGTVFDGKYRRYAVTEVLDHWSTVKPAYRVILEDGTTLVTSGDHRFLTRRGWKHVAPPERGQHQRPYLTTNNKLLGTGRFASPPKKDAGYRQGYLCGMIRGDGTIGSYPYMRPNGALGVAHGFRLALIDVEALARTREYLADRGIETREFVFQEATTTRKRVHAIRTQRRAHLDSIRELIAWPEDPSPGWQKGFLAGIFDAEGSRGDEGAFRIANSDLTIIHQIRSCLDQFGFASVVETQVREKPVRLRVSR